MKFAQRIEAIKPSATFAISARAQQLRAAGRDILNMGTGEPDFDTPDHIKAAAIAAIQAGQTKYTATDGVPALKEAIKAKFLRDNQLDYAHNELIVSNGGKQCFFNLAAALLNPGDEVIISAPYWVSYPDIATLMGATPVIINTTPASRYKINAADLQAAITNKTRLFILNSPSNPTGVAYTADELIALAEVLKKHPQVWIASDDIYEKILWNNTPFANILMVCPPLRDRCIVVNGVSKTYAMTGWRIGYAAGPAALIAGMKKVQEQSTSNPCSIAQAAAIAALNGPENNVAEMRNTYQKRQDLLLHGLSQINSLSAIRADGAFYCFLEVSSALKQLQLTDDVAFSDYLLDKVGLAVVPGSAFGGPNHVRLSFAVSEAAIEQAVTRLEQALS